MPFAIWKKFLLIANLILDNIMEYHTARNFIYETSETPSKYAMINRLEISNE